MISSNNLKITGMLLGLLDNLVGKFAAHKDCSELMIENIDLRTAPRHIEALRNIILNEIECRKEVKDE